MTFSIGNGQVTGAMRDDAITRFDAQLASTTPTAETTYTALGSDRCVKLPVGTNGSKALCASASDSNGVQPSLVNGQVTMFTFDVGGGSTTSAVSLLYNRGTQGNRGLIRLNNSPRVLEVYDDSNNLRAQSVSTWSTSALTRFYVMLDFLDGSNNTKIAIWNANGVLESYQTVGLGIGPFAGGSNNCYFGDWPAAGVNRGADIYGGMIIEQSSSADDNPLWARYPVLRVCGGGALPPTAVGHFDASGTDGWTGTMTPDTGTSKWKNLGATRDLAAPGSHPGNDGDTSYCGVAAGTSDYGHQQTFTYSAANPVPTGSKVRFVELGLAAKGTAGGKVICNGMLYDGTNTLILPFAQASTSYLGTKCSTVLNPAGNPWSVSDFDLSAGVSTLQFGGRGLTSGEASGASIGGRVTALPGPAIVYSLPGEYLQTLGSGY